MIQSNTIISSNTTGKIKNLFAFVFILFLTISCTRHHPQYSSEGGGSKTDLESSTSTLEKDFLTLSSKDSTSNSPPGEVIQVSSTQSAHGNLNSEKPLQDIYRKIRQTASLPIDYETQSAGGIDINQNLKALDSILHFDEIIRYNDESKMLTLSYKEGLNIIFHEEQPEAIVITKAYKGFLDFGAEIGKKRIGDSFASYFNLKAPLQKDLKNQDFIRSIFNYFEKTNVDCFSLDQCRTYFIGPLFVISLPKIQLSFSSDERRTLVNISFFKSPNPVVNQVNYQNRSVGGEPIEHITRLTSLPNISLDFGQQTGIRKLFDSFSDVMDLTSIHPERDPGVQNFIIALYNHLEETDINCLQEKSCSIENTNQIIFKLPKIELAFSKNKLALLEEIVILSEKIERVIQNIKVPYNHEQNSIANINLQMKKEEVENILLKKAQDNIAEGNKTNVAYTEGFSIMYHKNNEISEIYAFSKQQTLKYNEALREEVKNNQKRLFIYEGAFDFGPEIGLYKLGDSFSNHFDLNVQDITQDQKAREFIISLYNLWEKSDVNCLEIIECAISYGEDSISFFLPKANLLFSNDFQRNFSGIILKGLKNQEIQARIREKLRNSLP